MLGHWNAKHVQVAVIICSTRFADSNWDNSRDREGGRKRLRERERKKREVGRGREREGEGEREIKREKERKGASQC